MCVCVCVYTHCYRVLHVCDGGGELAEVEFRAVDEGVCQITAAPPRTHAGRLPLLAIGHDSGVVLPRGDALGEESS